MMRFTIRNKYVLTVNAISLMVAFLIHFPELIALSGSGKEELSFFPGMYWSSVIGEVIFTYFSLLFLFYLNGRLFHFGNSAVNIGWKLLCASFLLTWLLSNLLGKAFVFLHLTVGIPAIDASLHHYLHPLRDFLMSTIVTGTSYLVHLNRKSRRVLLENQQLRTENLVHQYEALKNQLNPHMLFNSLNTLYSLINEDSDKARNYVQELSRVLRYTLRVNETPTVTLQEEMDFVHSYIYLLQMRYENNLRFHIQIEPEALRLHLPPMSVQLLIENAVKHNEISNRHPLSVQITSQGNRLLISNPIQPKRSGRDGTHIGLSNLSNRYRLLYKQEIEIRETDNHFIVTLPLI